MKLSDIGMKVHGLKIKLEENLQYCETAEISGYGFHGIFVYGYELGYHSSKEVNKIGLRVLEDKGFEEDGWIIIPKGTLCTVANVGYNGDIDLSVEGQDLMFYVNSECLVTDHKDKEEDEGTLISVPDEEIWKLMV